MNLGLQLRTKRVFCMCWQCMKYPIEYANNTRTISEPDLIAESPLYTTDTAFLTDTQQLLTTMSLKADLEPIAEKHLDTIDAWAKLLALPDHEFTNRYMLLHPSIWKADEINRHPDCQQAILSLQGGSALWTLCFPLLILIIPCLVMCWSGQPYSCAVKDWFGGHILVRLCAVPWLASWQEKLVVLGMFMVYALSLYQQGQTLMRMHKLFCDVKAKLQSLKPFLEEVLCTIMMFQAWCKPLLAYNQFIHDELHLRLADMQHMICQLASPISATTMGKHTAHLYTLYRNHRDTILYATQFAEYFDQMVEMAQALRLKQVHKVAFVSAEKPQYIRRIVKGQEEPKEGQEEGPKEGQEEGPKEGQQEEPKEPKEGPTEEEQEGPTEEEQEGPKEGPTEGQEEGDNDTKPVVNIPLSGVLVVTGANASGKTTLIMSVIKSCIMAQQYGVSMFESSICPYDYFHYYRHIVDKENKLSLFEAQVKKYADIVAQVQVCAQNRHLCVMDEPFSGTNPTDATAVLTKSLQVLSELSNMHTLITTHYGHGLSVERVQYMWTDAQHMLRRGIDSTSGKGVSILENLLAY